MPLRPGVRRLIGAPPLPTRPATPASHASASAVPPVHAARREPKIGSMSAARLVFRPAQLGTGLHAATRPLHTHARTMRGAAAPCPRMARPTPGAPRRRGCGRPRARRDLQHVQRARGDRHPRRAAGAGGGRGARVRRRLRAAQEAGPRHLPARRVRAGRGPRAVGGAFFLTREGSGCWQCFGSHGIGLGPNVDPAVRLPGSAGHRPAQHSSETLPRSGRPVTRPCRCLPRITRERSVRWVAPQRPRSGGFVVAGAWSSRTAASACSRRPRPACAASSPPAPTRPARTLRPPTRCSTASATRATSASACPTSPRQASPRCARTPARRPRPPCLRSPRAGLLRCLAWGLQCAG